MLAETITKIQCYQVIDGLKLYIAFIVSSYDRLHSMLCTISFLELIAENQC